MSMSFKLSPDMQHVETCAGQRKNRDYVHGDHAAIRRAIALFAEESGVNSEWHESGLSAKLGGSPDVDNACPGDFRDGGEAFLELTNEDGQSIRVNLACLLAALTCDILETAEAARAVALIKKSRT